MLQHDPEVKAVRKKPLLVRILTGAGVFFVCILLLGVVFVLGCQRLFIYPRWLLGSTKVETPSDVLWYSDPAPNGDLTSSKFCWENVWLTAEDGVKTNAFWIKAISDCTTQNPDLERNLSVFRNTTSSSSSSSRLIPTAILFHGNVGSMSSQFGIAASLQRRFACNVLVLQYRGYGASQDSPTEAGIKGDVDAAVKWAAQRVSDLNSICLKNSQRPLYSPELIAYGRSLGGAAAIYAASSAPNHIQSVIVENTFLSIPKVLRNSGSLLLWPTSFLIYDTWTSEALMPLLHQRILALASTNDQIVPPHHSKALLELAVNARECRLFPLHGTGHNDATANSEYFSTISDFINK